eukprot:CAMPEP_0201704036 /NCGR_PEP_ID=MMETSP0578-20130828/41617_1 /ASSEMBLY_ACC=CAM_ASM_000663 /TAXON_ID=267565 /ORGANISM="Skeletonema grethea, Strain CCMP 1804" /LENGTH=111 /DNA_ID=CAMNT_0048191971 /DNA_START=259 /DNA_END=594 /DNA_ORIENTATION=-
MIDARCCVSAADPDRQMTQVDASTDADGESSLLAYVTNSSMSLSNTNVSLAAYRLETYPETLVRVSAPTTTPPLYRTARIVVPMLTSSFLSALFADSIDKNRTLNKKILHE